MEQARSRQKWHQGLRHEAPDSEKSGPAGNVRVRTPRGPSGDRRVAFYFTFARVSIYELVLHQGKEWNLWLVRGPYRQWALSSWGDVTSQPE